MESILKLQYISMCSRVGQELENHLGIRDKVLTEFVVELVRESKEQQDFERKLLENESEFPPDLTTKVFQLVKKMMPQHKFASSGTEKAQQSGTGEEVDVGEDVGQEQDGKTLDKKKLAQKFFGLAIKDGLRNKEEVDIDLDKLIDEDHTDAQAVNQDQKQNSPSPEKKDDDNQRKKNKNKSRKQHKKHGQRDSSSRSASPPSRSRSRSRSERGGGGGAKRGGLREEGGQIEEGRVYEGIVTNVSDHGAFVQLKGVRGRVEGLVHVSDISEKRLNNAFDAVRRNDQVRVKVLYVVGRKVKLSMKDVDQKTGELIVRERVDVARAVEEKQQPVKRGNELFGALTGVRLDAQDSTKRKKEKKRNDDENEMWEMSRLAYHAHMGLAKQTIDLDEEVSDDDDLAIDVSEKEPLFLKGQTTKGGIVLSPVRVVKNPEGTLQREAINAQQFAKERKELRSQQQIAIMDQMNKTELAKNWDDPTAEAGSRALVDQLRSYGLANAQGDDFKRDAMFKASRGGQRSLLSIKEQKESLPIFEFKQKLIDAVRANSTLIVIGETGSGKTTQMTQYLLEAGYAKRGKKICCTQPRRVAAMSVAKRVAEEMGVILGEEIGYSIRFEDLTSPQTIIKYCTDGMLLREALLDPDMSQYSVVMLDEAHERNVNTDVLFGLLKKVVQRRTDFKLIVTSATLDAEKFSSYFLNCNIFRIPGRTFPVEVMYSTDPESDYLDAALIVVLQIHLHEPAGDILLFLTGQEEIDNACQTLTERMKKLGPDAPELLVLPIYSALPSELQQRIFMPTPRGARKVVVATNIAEASITIDGIYYVVDPGFTKIKMFNPNLGHDVLQIVPISQASAKQRAGRAGRTGPGKCYRLYTEDAFKNEMLPTSVPEIQRTNLTHTVLTLKAMGINDLLNFEFMDPPPVQTLINSLESLYALGALDDEGLLTKMGMKMAEFPLSPQESKMLLTAVDLGCGDEICTIISMLQVHNVFFRPKDKATVADQKRAKFNHPDGDFLTILTVYEAWKQNNFSNIWCSENYLDAKNMRRAQDVRKQLVQILERYKFRLTVCNRDYARVRKAITAGFFVNAAKRNAQEGYKTIVDDHTVYIHPSSSLFNRQPEWVVYAELVLTSKEYMRNVCTIDPKWLVDVAPNFFEVSKFSNAKRKSEKLQPLQPKYGQDPNAWRLSKRRAAALSSTH